MTDAARSRPRWVVWAVLAAVLVVVAVGAVVLLTPDDPAPTYDEDTRAAFLAACSADGGDDVLPVCGCWYDAIERTIPYERYDEVNRALLAEPLPRGATVEVPDDFAALLDDCRIPG